MGVEWKWLEAAEGLPGGVEVAGKRYAWKASEPEELLRFHEDLLDAGEVYRGLRQAKLQIEAGALHSYDGAAARLLSIVRELRKAELALHEAALGFSVFFDPPGLMQAFAGDSDAIRRFIDDAAERLEKGQAAPAAAAPAAEGAKP